MRRQELKLDAPWDSPFVREWLARCRRGSATSTCAAFSMSAANIAPLITPEDRLSSKPPTYWSRSCKTPIWRPRCGTRLSRPHRR